MNESCLSPYHDRLKSVSPFRISGTVTEVTGLLIASRGPWLPVGGVCHIYPQGGAAPVAAEVVGFRDGQTLFMPLGELRGVGPGSKVVALTKEAHYQVGEALSAGSSTAWAGPLTARVSSRPTPIRSTPRRRIPSSGKKFTSRWISVSARSTA
jgi:flagellum-specific ATP synthase